MLFIFYLMLPVIYLAIWVAHYLIPSSEIFDFSRAGDWFVAFFFFPFRYFVIFMALLFAYLSIGYLLYQVGGRIRKGWQWGEFSWSALLIFSLTLLGLYEGFFFFPILTSILMLLVLSMVLIQSIQGSIRRNRMIRLLAPIHNSQQHREGAVNDELHPVQERDWL